MHAVATVGIQAAYTVSEEAGTESVCVTMTGMREIDLTLTFSTQPQAARGKQWDEAEYLHTYT